MYSTRASNLNGVNKQTNWSQSQFKEPNAN